MGPQSVPGRETRIISLIGGLVMAVAPGTIRVHQHEQTVTFLVEGWTTMQQSLSFRRVAEEGLGRGANIVRVDLRGCTFMDSTFVGTLLNLKRAVHRCQDGDFALVSPSAQCVKLFQQMGLEGFFPAVPGEEAMQSSWAELTCEPRDDYAFKCNVVEAHQELASMGGRTGEIFRPVARCLAQEMEGAKKP
jgi:anti-anti-sigma factor